MPKASNRSSLTKKSQITLPKHVREILDVGPGDQVAFLIQGSDVKIVAVPSVLDRNFGRVKPRERPEDFAEVRRRFEQEVAGEALRES